MKIYDDEKLAYQRRKERKQSGKELRTFCEQFSFQHKTLYLRGFENKRNPMNMMVNVINLEFIHDIDKIINKKKFPRK